MSGVETDTKIRCPGDYQKDPLYLKSMTKYLFQNYRLPMYSYVNRLLRNGKLSRITGAHVRNRIFNKDFLSFPEISYWRIDREDFFADVSVKLILETDAGKVEWHGVIILWCSFEGDFSCEFEELVEKTDRKADGFPRLSPFLVPYSTNQRMDEIADKIWKQYGMGNALTDPKARDAAKLAGAMGLTVEYHEIYNHKGVDSILFFTDDDLEIGEDRIEKRKDGREEHIKAPHGEPTHIKANTIVVNTNRIKRDFSSFNIYHEIIHFQEHYLFFRLQQMGNNDPRKFEVKEVEVTEGHEIRDPVYFMEKQANRGAYGLMMPAADTRRLIHEELAKTDRNENAGARFEKTGIAVAAKLFMPHFRMRARMIQLGFIEAKGALNYVERKMISPFAFDVDAWREEQHTFVISESTVTGLCRQNDDFSRIMDGGRYVYVDGHVVRNEERFVEKKKGKIVLTEEALDHIDDCCLRFVRVYVQNYIGRYVFGRMYYDADYEKQTLFYLNDLINQRNLDEFDAKKKFREEFPMDFKEAVGYLKKLNKKRMPPTII